MYNNNRFFHATNEEFILPGLEPKVKTNYNSIVGAMLGITKPLGGFWCSIEKYAWRDFAKYELERELKFIHKIQAERPKRGLVWSDEVHSKMESSWGPTFWEDLSKDYDYVVFPCEWVSESRFKYDLAYTLDIGCVVFLVGQWTQRI